MGYRKNRCWFPKGLIERKREEFKYGTPYAAAKRLGVSYERYREAEAGNHIGIKIAEKIADGYGIEIKDEWRVDPTKRGKEEQFPQIEDPIPAPNPPSGAVAQEEPNTQVSATEVHEPAPQRTASSSGRSRPLILLIVIIVFGAGISLVFQGDIIIGSDIHQIRSSESTNQFSISKPKDTKEGQGSQPKAVQDGIVPSPQESLGPISKNKDKEEKRSKTAEKDLCEDNIQALGEKPRRCPRILVSNFWGATTAETKLGKEVAKIIEGELYSLLLKTVDSTGRPANSRQIPPIEILRINCTPKSNQFALEIAKKTTASMVVWGRAIKGFHNGEDAIRPSVTANSLLGWDYNARDAVVFNTLGSLDMSTIGKSESMQLVYFTYGLSCFYTNQYFAAINILNKVNLERAGNEQAPFIVYYALAVSYFNTNKCDLAKKYASVLSESARDASPMWGIVAELLLSEAFNRDGESDKALTHGLKAYDLIKENYSSNHFFYSWNYSVLADVHTQLEKFNKAMEYYQKALKTLDSLPGDLNCARAALCESIADALQNALAYDESEKWIRKAWEIRTSSCRKESMRFKILHLVRLGKLEAKKGRYDESWKKLNQALRIVNRSSVDANAIIAQIYKAKASAYQDRELYSKALEYYLKVEQVLLKMLRNNHPVLASIYANLGLCQIGLGNPIEATKYFKRSFDIQKGNPSMRPLPAQQIKFHLAYGVSLQTMGENTRALSQFYQATEIGEKQGKEYYCLLVRAYSFIALSMQLEGEPEYASQTIKSALRIAQSVVCKEDETLALAIRIFAQVMQLQKQYQTALAYLGYYWSVVSTNKQSPNAIIDGHVAMGSVMHDLGFCRESKQHYTKAEMLIERTKKHKLLRKKIRAGLDAVSKSREKGECQK